MSLDDHDPLYDGGLANDALGRLINAEWDAPRPPTTSCAGGKHFARMVALLATRLEEGPAVVSTPSDITRLADEQSSWARYIDPALSVFRVPPVRVGIALWECSTHIAYLVQQGPGWRAVVQSAAVDRILALAQLQRSSSHSNRAPVEEASSSETGRQGVNMVPQQAPSGSSDTSPNPSPGLSLGDFAELWLEEGFSPEEAQPWAAVGLLPLHAKRWRGWPAHDAISFALQALRPADVMEWQRTYPHESPVDWLGAGIPLVAAAEWLDHGYQLADADRFVERGIRTPRHVQR